MPAQGLLWLLLLASGLAVAEELDPTELAFIQGLGSQELCERLAAGSLPAEGLLREIGIRAIDCDASPMMRIWDYSPEPHRSASITPPDPKVLEPGSNETVTGNEKPEIKPPSPVESLAQSPPPPPEHSPSVAGTPQHRTDSTVRVIAPQHSGSGFYLDHNHVVTNAHVVGQANGVLLAQSEGVPFEGHVVYRNPEIDFAVISTDRPGQPLAVRESALIPGEDIMTLGYPQGRKRLAASTGTIEAVTVCCVYHDALIAGGSSGGPLLDGQQSVIGLNTLISKKPGDRTNSHDRAIAVRLDFINQVLRPKTAELAVPR